MDPRSKKAIFIGLPSHIKGYILYDLLDKNVFISRDVVFYESQFPFAEIAVNPKVDISDMDEPPLPVIPINMPMQYTDFEHNEIPSDSAQGFPEFYSQEHGQTEVQDTTNSVTLEVE